MGLVVPFPGSGNIGFFEVVGQSIEISIHVALTVFDGPDSGLNLSQVRVAFRDGSQGPESHHERFILSWYLDDHSVHHAAQKLRGAVERRVNVGGQRVGEILPIASLARNAYLITQTALKQNAAFDHAFDAIILC